MPYFFFFNDTATTEIYTLSLHDALPICRAARRHARDLLPADPERAGLPAGGDPLRLGLGHDGAAAGRTDPRLPVRRRRAHRSEEHTSELQSRQYLVCRLLLEKKKTQNPH